MAEENRRAQRHRLTGAAVKVTIIHPSAEPSRGRVRDISATGGLYIETKAPFPPRSLAQVDLALPDGRALTFAGNVARHDAEGMAILLESDPALAPFLASYVEAAKKAHETGSLEIRAELVEERSVEIALSRAWFDVIGAPADAANHQRFVDACINAKRLDYALTRLRALKAAQPDLAPIDRSLAQLARILDFVALSRGSSKAGPEKERLLPGLLAFFLIALGLLGLVAMVKIATEEVHVHTEAKTNGR